jgi:hypothetical protein
MFVCPRCGLDRDASEIEPQRWISLLGVPVIPIGAEDHLVSCNVCRHRCDLGVLDIPTTEVLAVYVANAIRHGVATIVRAGLGPDGRPDEAIARVAVATVVADGHRYDLGRLTADLVGLDDTETTAALRRLANEMTSHGKQGFLHRLAAIAIVDGNLSEPEREALVAMGVALGMPAHRVNDVITIAELEVETT